MRNWFEEEVKSGKVISDKWGEDGRWMHVISQYNHSATALESQIPVLDLLFHQRDVRLECISLVKSEK